MRGVTVIEVTGAVVIFDKYHEYNISDELTTNLSVLKHGENNIQDTINQGQHSTEHFGLIVSDEIFAVYRHLKLAGMKTSLRSKNNYVALPE